MAVRVFDGVDDRIGLDSLELELCAGAFSIVALVKPTSVDTGEIMVGLTTGGVLIGSLSDAGSGRLALYTSELDVQALVNFSAGDWQIIALTKPQGTNVVRFHRKALGTGGWTHTSSAGTHPDIPGVVDTVTLGNSTPVNAVSVKDMRLAVAAVFDSEISDGDIEAVQTLATTQYLVDLNAVSVWELNQASTVTPVSDLVSDADQTAITGTTVVTDDDPPGWTFGAVVIPPLEFSLRLSGGAANDSPSASIGGAESSEPAPIDLFDNASNSQRTSGVVDYRLIYVHNDDEDDGTAVAWVPSNLEAGREIALGVAAEASGVEVDPIADDETPPAGVSFSAPAAIGGGVDTGTIDAGEARGLWVRRTVNSGTAVDPTNIARIQLQTLRTE